ncbi:MAG: MMPL family transporter [Candidatus Wallbacteria bacterium]|nr:MMPL family transporter [Candidatus Wallbacteria bacterium]
MSRAERITTGYLRWVLDHRRLVAGLVLLALIPCGLAAAKLRVNNTITTWFLETDENLKAYYAYQEVFGNDEVVLVAVRDPETVFTPRVLAAVREATLAIAAQKHVQRVLSITNATSMESHDGTLSVRPVLPDSGPIDAALASRVKREILADPGYIGNIISPDARTALMVVQMKKVADIDAARTEALAELREVLERSLSRAGIPHATGGIGVIYDALNQLTVVEGGVLIGLSYLIITLSMVLILRSGRLAALGLGVVYVTMTLTMGLYALTGRSLNMVTVILPSLLLVIVVVDFIHVVVHFHHAGPVPSDPDARRQAVIERIGRVAVPCFYTSLTTATGFLALAVSPISLVRDLGLFGGAGAFVEWFVTITFGAIALDALTPVADFRPNDPGGWIRRFLDRVTRWTLERRGTTAMAAIGVTLFFAAGMTRLSVDTYTVGYFKDSHQVRRDHEFIEGGFGYYIPIELTLRTARARGLQEPEVLARVERLHESLTAEPEISRALSLTSFSKRVHQVLAGGEPASYTLPRTLDESSQELLLYEMDPDNSLSQYVTRDYGFGRISGRMKMMSVRPGKELMEKLEGRLQGVAGSEGTVKFAGYLPLYVKIIDYLVESQVKSFSLAVLFVFGPMYLLFRSVRLTLVSVVPNVLPIAIVLGTMGWLGIPLDVATVTIAAIVLGIAVDDTIHFLHGFRERRARGLEAEDAIREVIAGTGKAVVTTTVMLFFGFAVMGISSVKPVAYFGVLSGASLLAGLVCEFLVTPVLLVAFYPSKRAAAVVSGGS